jgi:hypothetical protein
MDNSNRTTNPFSLVPSAGRIDIDLFIEKKLAPQEQLITRVVIKNSRPINLGRLLVGLSPERALKRISTLFLLCSQAQQAAAFGALCYAMGGTIEASKQQYLIERCSLEWLKEHCWQLWMMGRALFGDDFSKHESISVTQMLLKNLQRQPTLSLSAFMFPNNIKNNKSVESSDPLIEWQAIKDAFTPMFGIQPKAFLTLSWTELMCWSKRDAPYAKLWSKMLDSTLVEFGAIKNWNPDCESGPLSRSHQLHPLIEQSLTIWGTSLTTRTLAKLIELAQACVNPQIAAPVGNGLAQTSRGALKHTVYLDKFGMIKEYIIDAPTDRHFRNEGLLSASLLGQTILTRHIEMVKQLVWVLDPCVEFSVHICNQDTN